MIQGIKRLVMAGLISLSSYGAATAQTNPTTYNSVNITTATTTLVKSGSGSFRKFCINTPVASSVFTIYDSLTATGTKLATITLPATVSPSPTCVDYNIAFATGLTVVSTMTSDLTVSWSNP